MTIRKIVPTILLCLLPAAACASIQVPIEERTRAPRPQYEEHEVLITWKQDTPNPAQRIKTVINKRGKQPLKHATVRVRKHNTRRNFSVVRSEDLTTQELIRHFEDMPEVEQVVENQIFYTQSQATPWGVDDSTGVRAQSANGEGYTGDGVIVAVLDTGIDIDHTDLDANLWSPTSDNCTIRGVFSAGGCPNGGYDFVNDDNNPNDDHGHGTHVSGTIAAEDNTRDVVGVAPDATLMGVKVLGADGSGTVDEIIEGIDFAVENGADIINMSLGGNQLADISYQTYQDTFDDAYTAGVTVIAAAGNESTNVASSPAMYEHVISVGAVQELTTQNNPYESHDTRLAYFSNWGKVDIVAPGMRVNSTTFDGGTSGNTYNGTSMAAPHVAGVAALLKEKRSTLTPEQIKHILESTATDMGASGRDEFYGSGFVNATAALAKTDESSTKTIILEGNWAENSNEASEFNGYYEGVDIASTRLPADGSSASTLRVRVRTEDGDAVASQLVNLSTTGGTLSASTATTDSDGNATVTLTAPSVAGSATVTATIDGSSTSSSVEMTFADTLLVSDAGFTDDGGANEQWFFYNALEELGTNWHSSQEAYASNISNLADYDAVVWHTATDSLSTDEQSLLETFVSNGGNLFLSGGNTIEDAQDAELFSTYMQVAYSAEEATDLTFVGDGDFETVGGEVYDYGSTSSDYTDVVTVGDQGQAMGYFCTNTEVAVVAVESTYRSLFAGMSIEELDRPDREEVIENALDFLADRTQSGGSSTVPEECDTEIAASDYAEPAEDTTDDTVTLSAPDQGVVTKRTRQKVSFSLNDPDNTGYDFIVQLKNKKKTKNVRKKTVSGNTVTFKNLDPKKTYRMRYRLTYTNDEGETVKGPFSDYKKVVTKNDRPTKLKVVDTTETSVKVQWRKPAGTIKKYVIQLQDKSTGSWELYDKFTSKKKLKKTQKRKNLTPLPPAGTELRFRVRAIFKNGDKGRFTSYKKIDF